MPLALLGVALVLMGNLLAVGRGLGIRWRRQNVCGLIANVRVSLCSLISYYP